MDELDASLPPPFSHETAGTIVYTAAYGSAPDATELTVLTQFTQAQYAYGQQIGVMDPGVYAYQALGVALASSGQHFQNEFGPSNPRIRFQPLAMSTLSMLLMPASSVTQGQLHKSNSS